MTILYLCPHYTSPGGAVVHARRLVEEMARRGHQVALGSEASAKGMPHPVLPESRVTLLLIRRNAIYEKCLNRLAAIARHLKARGLKVLWKDHPRNTGGISQAMRRADISCVPDSFRYLPAEIIACMYEINSCFGGLSSSLLYMDHLLGMKTGTYLDGQWICSMNADDQQVSRLVLNHVAPL